jgi:hypothetical protein
MLVVAYRNELGCCSRNGYRPYFAGNGSYLAPNASAAVIVF